MKTFYHASNKRNDFYIREAQLGIMKKKDIREFMNELFDFFKGIMPSSTTMLRFTKFLGEKYRNENTSMGLQEYIMRAYKQGFEDIGKIFQYYGHSISNKNYVYLLKRPKTVKKNRNLYQIDLPENHPIERDHDQLIALKEISEIDALETIENICDSLDIEFNGNMNDSNLKNIADQIEEYYWNKHFMGAYRTSKNIPVELIQLIS